MIPSAAVNAMIRRIPEPLCCSLANMLINPQSSLISIHPTNKSDVKHGQTANRKGFGRLLPMGGVSEARLCRMASHHLALLFDRPDLVVVEERSESHGNHHVRHAKEDVI